MGREDAEDIDEAVRPLIGGPFDGGEVDTEHIFAGRVPEKLGIGRGGADWMTASYALDADGTRYRFTGTESAAIDRARDGGSAGR